MIYKMHPSYGVSITVTATRSPVANRAGFTLVEVMVVAGLVSGIALALTSLTLITQKQQSQSNLTFQADTTRRNMMTTLNSTAGWTITTADPANNTDPLNKMICASQKNCANPNSEYPFYKIVDGAGSPVFIGGPSTGNYLYGINAQGPCSTFDPINGNDACPVTFTLQWEPICSGPCTSTSYQNTLITVTALYNPQTLSKRVAFNPANYSNTFYQGSTTSSCTWVTTGAGLSESCLNVGIGTTTPGSPLTVVSSNPNAISIQGNNASSASLNIIETVAGGHNWTLGTAGTAGPGSLGELFFYDNTQTATRMMIDASGNVGIGTTAPTQQLTVSQYIQAQGILMTSDRSEKKRIEPLSGVDSIEKISRLQPVSFDWKNNGNHDFGVIAQDLETVYPDMVVKDGTGKRSVRYTSLIGPILSAIQELKHRDDELEAKNAELNAKVKTLETRLIQAQGKK